MASTALVPSSLSGVASTRRKARFLLRSSRINSSNTVCTRAIASPSSSSSSSPPPPPPPPSSSARSVPNIPAMEPFNRSRLSRLLREPSLLEKASDAIADRCTILEGDEAHRCWEALFEFQNLKDEYTLHCDVAASEERAKACRARDRLENLVRQSGGVASLIHNVTMLAEAKKIHQQGAHPHVSAEPADCSPPAQEDLELEKARMPESPWTRLLRRMGNPTSWFYP